LELGAGTSGGEAVWVAKRKTVEEKKHINLVELRDRKKYRRAEGGQGVRLAGVALCLEAC
jgi:hypothetical protein